MRAWARPPGARRQSRVSAPDPRGHGDPRRSRGPRGHGVGDVVTSAGERTAQVGVAPAVFHAGRGRGEPSRGASALSVRTGRASGERAPCTRVMPSTRSSSAGRRKRRRPEGRRPRPDRRDLDLVEDQVGELADVLATRPRIAAQQATEGRRRTPRVGDVEPSIWRSMCRRSCGGDGESDLRIVHRIRSRLRRRARPPARYC